MATTETEWQDSEPQSTGERAKEEASRLGDAVQQEAGEVLDEAKDQTRQTIDRGEEPAEGRGEATERPHCRESEGLGD